MTATSAATSTAIGLDWGAASTDEHVVLIDRHGRACGTAAKRTAHNADTPLHLAFSCYLIDADGRLLLTRRAAHKATWPSVWTNACCGHPQLGETLRQTIDRRVADELGVRPLDLGLVLADFTYRAELDGVVEHELCPVLVARIDTAPQPDPDEVDRLEWVSWDALVQRANHAPDTLSPWCVAQIARLVEIGWAPDRWLDGERYGVSQRTLDRRNDEPPAAAPASELEPLTPRALDVVDAAIVPVLRRHVGDKAAAFARLDPALAAVAAEVDALVAAGGKRLRPAFVYWGHRATGADHHDGSLHVAAAIELLHTFALLHDDVMDRSATRRGRPTANRALTTAHRRAGHAGDCEWFGTSAAILAGDLTFAWAVDVLDAAPVDGKALDRCRTVFAELRTEVMAGQYLDLLGAGDAGVGEAAAAKIALLKSARYTVTRPLLLGAALCDPTDVDPGVAPTLERYGDAVGLAFQLRDDVLGLFGDPAVTGKSALDDVRAGKTTLLMVRARRLANAAQRRVLDAGVGNRYLDDAGADRVRQVVADSGALASVEALLHAKHATAVDAVATLPDPSRHALTELAALAIERRT